MAMSLSEIKKAVDAGKTVHWKNDAYTVVSDKYNQYFIGYDIGGRRENYIGLTHSDGKTLNGSPDDFYVFEGEEISGKFVEIIKADKYYGHKAPGYIVLVNGSPTHLASKKDAVEFAENVSEVAVKKNPAPFRGTSKPRRKSQITGKPPTKRLVKRRKKNTEPGYFPNPVQDKMSVSKKKSNFPYAVEKKATENWSIVSAFKVKADAFEYAHALAKKYPQLPIRVMHYSGGEKKNPATRKGTAPNIKKEHEEQALSTMVRLMNSGKYEFPDATAYVTQRYVITSDRLKKLYDALYEKNPAPFRGTTKPRRKSQITGAAPSKRLVKRRVKNTKRGYFPNPIQGEQYENALHGAFNELAKAVNNKQNALTVQARVAYLEGIIDAGMYTGILSSAQYQMWKRKAAEMVALRVK